MWRNGYEFKEKFKLNNKTLIYMLPSMYELHKEEIEKATDYILNNCKDLNLIDISDVHAGGIQIGGCHNSEPGYIIISLTFKYDFSDFNDIIELFIQRWNSLNIKGFKEFIKDGKKYGWE